MFNTIQQGDTFLCIDNYDMDGETLYTKGSEYMSAEDWHITNNNLVDGGWGKVHLPLCNRHFVKIRLGASLQEGTLVWLKGKGVVGVIQRVWEDKFAVLTRKSGRAALVPRAGAVALETEDCSYEVKCVPHISTKGTDTSPLTETTIYNPLDDMVGGSHYKDGKLQPMEFAAMHEYTPPQYTAFKYVHRHRNKNGAQDIAKGIHCLHLLLKIEYGMTYEEARQQPPKK